MSRTTLRARAVAATAPLLLLVACTGTSELAGDDRGGAAEPSGGTSSLVTIPAADTPTRTASSTSIAAGAPATVAMIDADGQLGIVREGAVSNEWFKFDAFPSPDRSTAVMTLGPEIQGIGPERPVMWVSLPDGEPEGEQTMRTASELTATSLDGTLAGFTTRAGEPVGDAIAGVRHTSEIEIISRDDGLVFSQTLDGNFVPEAFGRTTTAEGVPGLVFLLEYLPAEAPRFYRVRVLSTETGDVSVPLNLRDKSQQLDERMAGFSRSQVVAEEHGLLFTLYRGTVDGTPDGESYAFVHTLDFADGVWCLEVDPRLELDRVAGSLAVGGDRLYVVSANGFVGAYAIPSLSDPDLSPSMQWVVDTGVSTDGAPVITADEEVVYVPDPARPGYLAHIHRDGLLHPAVSEFHGDPTAFAWDDDGSLQAVGADWATFDLVDDRVDRPDWLGEIEVLVVGH